MSVAADTLPNIFVVPGAGLQKLGGWHISGIASDGFSLHFHGDLNRWPKGEPHILFLCLGVDTVEELMSRLDDEYGGEEPS